MGFLREPLLIVLLSSLPNSWFVGIGANNFAIFHPRVDGGSAAKATVLRAEAKAFALSIAVGFISAFRIVPNGSTTVRFVP